MRCSPEFAVGFTCPAAGNLFRQVSGFGGKNLRRSSPAWEDRVSKPTPESWQRGAPIGAGLRGLCDCYSAPEELRASASFVMC